MVSHKSKGDLAVNAMVGIAFGIITAALVYYVWTNGLPVETQTLTTGVGS